MQYKIYSWTSVGGVCGLYRTPGQWTVIAISWWSEGILNINYMLSGLEQKSNISTFQPD